MTDSATGATEADARLHRLLGGDDVAWLVRRARDRLETGRSLSGTVTLADATARQRRAVERLTGRPARSGVSLSVSLPELDRIVRESGAAADGLAEAVTRLTGPLRDLNRDRADTAAAWAAAVGPLDDAVAGRAELAAWRVWLDTTGTVRRLASSPDVALALLEQVAAVLRRLPSRGTPIGRLAAECCGDAHALDDGRPVGTLALSASRALAGRPFAGDGGADSRRAAWAAVGVHCDDLSSLVLCHGLAGDGRTALGRVLALQREAGQPAVLTLRQLRCHDEPLRAAGPVRVCENPVVVAAAADELGASCQPLLCVGGQPSAAGWRLLDLLAAGGAEFRYHGDFDWGGIRIAEAVRTRISGRGARWHSWHYDRDAYEALAAALTTAHPLARLPQSPGEPVGTPWDPALATAMARHGVRIEEELTLDTLLADLAELRGNRWRRRPDAARRSSASRR
ncbi:TIGR02679 family protein [Trebonia kvetii]|uniref:TIGR02679 family protein n=1 Tax=Trebonia kvetii TaxID=2480626 RepID=A0A6P2BWX3_9ACTN|nr:TIGR02679 family protein [Trebonia kvetii]TVZ03582.1 TIGR02679 family protein [Trebonia kvetii]